MGDNNLQASEETLKLLFAAEETLKPRQQRSGLRSRGEAMEAVVSPLATKETARKGRERRAARRLLRCLFCLCCAAEGRQQQRKV